MAKIDVNIEYLGTVNYALFHNKIPVCQFVDIHNLTDQMISEVTVHVEGEYILKNESNLAHISAGETVRLSSFDISPNVVQLTTLTERISTSFTLTITSQEEIIHTKQYEIDLMPYDHWLGTTILPQTIASFVTPNHPAINTLVLKTAEVLKQISGSSSLNEYSSRNTDDVRAQVAAVFAAIHMQGIVYRPIPASYEEIGQRVTMPDQVLSTKIGNCIELTLLFASVLEAIGINAGIVIMHGHAYLAAWLVDDCYPSSICDDASYIEKAISKGIDDMMVLECTMVTAEDASFDKAVAIAERNLADLSSFEMFIDIKRCRLENILPLPTRIQQDGKWTFDTNGVEHDACHVALKQHDRYDLSKIADSSKELTKFDIWERKLLDFSLRNSLLNINLRRRAIQFISFEVGRIEDHLQNGEEYCITPKPDIHFQFDTSERLVRSKMHGELSDFIANDIDQCRLHTYLTENETKNILKNIYRSSRNSLEETGANSLFLAIGTLRWFETPASMTPRYAPILLLAVDIVYKRGNYYIRTRDEEITLNITLKEFLSQNYDIKINKLDTLPHDESGVNVPLIFAIIRDALREQKGWDIEEECILGTFSFSKFLMWNDIHNHRKELLENDVVNSLVETHLTWAPDPISSNLKELDEQISPAQLALPVPVDSSQMEAIIEAGKCHSFILYGPPGTGKSQTITNLIANALYHEKRVLFVAEKMAALSVVQSRLANIGLSPFCLELHSNKSTKRHVLEQLDKALNVTHIALADQFQNTADKLFEQRKELISYINALHEVNESDGLSLYDCILRYESIEGEQMKNFCYSAKLDDVLVKDGVRRVEELLGSKFETVIKLVGQPSAHPLNGLHLNRSLLMDKDGVVEAMLLDREVIAEEISRADELKGAKALRENILRDNADAILNEDAESLRQEWRVVKSKWFIPRFFATRGFISKLKVFNPLVTAQEVDSLLDNLLDYSQKHTRIERLHAIHYRYFDIAYPIAESPESKTASDCMEKLSRWAEHEPQMRDWLHWSEYCDELTNSGMACVAAAMQEAEHEPSEMRNAYMKSLFRHKIEERMRKSDTLSAFEGMLFDEKIATYKQLTEEFQLLTQQELYARLAARVPRITDNLDSSSEISLLCRNINNGGRGLSLRDLFEQLPTLLPRLCPCMLMSPLSVAQYLDLSREKFDLVVFDEASQMPTSEAVGAIARGKSLIVVGDPKQMPPTSFFSSSNVDEEDAAIDDMDSILEDCQTLGMSPLQLTWHYRSRHESLIAFSNNEYYDGSLITFPSVDDQQTKVHYVPVMGTYDKGGKRQNRAEAEAIVEEIERRLKDEHLRQKSIGVIAFSVVQQSLIEDLLQASLESDNALHDAAEDMYEPIFVKNLENVQGDERDVILFSIGYGPDKTGKVSMNFGPLNNSGGERRLNVAVSRAREEMYIFSTLKSADIDLRRSKARGVVGLKHFLTYAETQSLPTILSNSHTIRQDNLMAEKIAAALEAKGYVVKTNVGRSQFKVDVAVGDANVPGVYKLGILLDGISYRDTHTTRDREIVQPSVLESLNWQIMRVWSVDWYNNPERVISRIEERFASQPSEVQNQTPKQIFSIEQQQLEEVQNLSKDYVTCQMSVGEAYSLGNEELMRRVVADEQPITFMYLCRRVNALRDAGRVTPNTQRALKFNLSSFYQDSSKAIWLSKEDCDSYKNYRANSDRGIADIPQIELINAILETLREQVALSADGLILNAAKKLGFTRRGTNVRSAFNNALNYMQNNDMVEMIGENFRLKNNFI